MKKIFLSGNLNMRNERLPRLRLAMTFLKVAAACGNPRLFRTGGRGLNTRNLKVAATWILVAAGFSLRNSTASPPEISGKYEQGQRYVSPNEEYFWDAYGEYDENEDDTMYSFRKGFFQLKQDLFKKTGYSVRYEENRHDYQDDNRDHDRKYLIISLKGEPVQKLNLKGGFYYREQEYFKRAGTAGNNVINAPFLEARYNPFTDWRFILSYRHKIQDFSAGSDLGKNKKIDFLILGAETELYGVDLSFRYKIDYRNYSANSALNNTLKDSFSVGFRYKFK